MGYSSGIVNKLFLDIETLPASDDQRSILEYLCKRSKDKKAKKKGKSEEEEVTIGGIDDFITKTSFDGAYGRILCIVYALNNDEPKVICNDGNEKKTLEEFWEIAKNCDLFIGHNVMDFDLRFIYQRSIVLGVKPTKDLSFARYRNMPIFDTMKEWSKWGQNNFGLEHIALALGIPSPKDGIDGSEVFNFYKAGKIKDICEYCKRDVDVTRRVYKRMVFEE
jgi:predicted PolB exonuclease-like 3'-5' exonuclease